MRSLYMHADLCTAIVCITTAVTPMSRLLAKQLHSAHHKQLDVALLPDLVRPWSAGPQQCIACSAYHLTGTGIYTGGGHATLCRNMKPAGISSADD